MIQFLAQTACFLIFLIVAQHDKIEQPKIFSLRRWIKQRFFVCILCSFAFVSLLIWLILIAVLVRKIDLKVELCIHFQEMFVNRNNRALIMNRKTS